MRKTIWYYIVRVFTLLIYALLLFASILVLCLIFSYIHPNFKSQSILDLIVNNVVNIFTTAILAVGMVELYERKRQKVQVMLDWVRHLEELYVSLRSSLLTSQKSNDIYAKAFVEEAKVLTDYLDQTLALVGSYKYKVSANTVSKLKSMKNVSEQLSNDALQLLEDGAYESAKGDIILSSLAVIHMSITSLSAGIILNKRVR